MSDATAPPPSSDEFDPFAGPALARVIATTESQREIWLATQLGREASLAYNESVAIRLTGTLDARALAQALNALVARHELLRATVGRDGLELLVAESLALALESTDLRALAAEQRATVIEDARAAAVEQPFDLAVGPLVRAHLLTLADDEHLLLLTLHHIVCDGWSFGVLLRDLARLYDAARSSTPATLAPAASYADYARAEAQLSASPEFSAAEQFWLQRYSGSVPVLDLTTDRPRPANRTFASLREDYVLDASLVADLKRQAGHSGASLFGVLLAGFAALLTRLSGEADVVIGVPAAGQAAADMLDLVGHCVNLLPVRIAVDLEAPGEALIAAAQGTLFDAYEHQRYTFGTLLKKLRIARDPARLPLVSVMFNLDQALEGEALAWPGLAVEVAASPRHFENFELFVNAVQVDGGLRLECQYNTGLYDSASVRVWMAAYEAILRSLAGQPATPPARVDIVGAADRARLAALNDTRADYDRSATVASLLAPSLAGHAARTAAVCQGQAITYHELDAQSTGLARVLRERGAVRGALVGLHVERGLPMLIAQLAVLKSGAAYVPLDPSYPAERLAYMAGDAGLTALVSTRALLERLPWPREATLLLDDDAPLIAAAAAAPLAADAQLDARPRDAAYVIYTSGSTGKPKGVIVPHGAVVNFLTSMARAPGLDAADRLLAVTTLSFDIAVLELLLPLALGATVILATREEAGDGFELTRLLDEHDASAIQATPSTWRLLIDAGWRGGPAFKALVGGEALAADLAAQLLERCGEVWNMYGPTETTVWSTCWKVERPERGISIGRPIANTSVWILDAQRLPCPPGVPGEICIGGEGVTLGYLHRPELTAERFIDDPFSTNGGKLYRTGDRGRWRHDGLLEHQGRFDFQIKLRGYRIELGEIEANLMSHPAIARTAVITREDRPGDVRLVAYLVARDTAPDAGALREHLRLTLPDYMIPQHFVVLPALPLMPNGKLDRHALPSPQQPAADRDPPTESRAAATDTERAVVRAMEVVLSLPGLSATDGFFALGGHSLLAAQLAMKLSRALDLQIPMRTVFDAQTPAALAAWIDAQRSAGAGRALRIERRADQSSAPLSLMQQRLWFLEQLHSGRSVHNVPSGHRLLGTLDAPALQGALNAVLQRQSALRTVIDVIDGVPQQRVLDEVELNLLPAEDLSALDHELRERALADRLSSLAQEPFDLAEGPLVRAHLFQLAPQEHVLFFMAHHLVWDGWSFDLLYNEMAALYPAYCAARGDDEAAPLAPLPVSYGDFAAWQRAWVEGPEPRRQVDHWKALLAGAGTPLQLPADTPRPPVQSGAGATRWVDLDTERTGRLHALARSADTTLFVVLLAAYAVLLHRLSGQDDLVIGTPVRGRNLPEVEHVMGFFVNALPLRLRVVSAATFSELLRSVRSTVLDALAHPDVPFEHLVRELRLPRDESRFPLYQAFFSFQDARGRPTHWGDLQHRPNFVRRSVANEDLGLWFLEREDGLRGALNFNTDILTPASGERIRAFAAALLARVPQMRDAPLASLLERAADDASLPTAWQALPAEPAAARPATASARARPQRDHGPSSPDEQTLATIWSELLGVRTVRATDNFFDLGGHSLLAMSAIVEMDKRLGRRVNPRRYIFETLAQIAAAPDERPAPVKPRGLVGRLMSSLRREGPG